MPNPNDSERSGNKDVRAQKLVDSAGQNGNSKLNWIEWFGTASNTWLGGATTAYVGDMISGGTRSSATTMAAMALGGTIAGITGFWLVAPLGAVVVDVVGKKLEDMAKEGVPFAVQKGREAIGRYTYGGSDPGIVLNRPLGDDTLEATILNIKNNSALIQDLLNKLAGKAGKAYFCDDVFAIAALAGKLTLTKGELTRDIDLMRRFLTQLEDELKNVKEAEINDKVKVLAEAICAAADGRHWDNSWTSSTISRMSRCSRQHCFGPK